VKRSHSEESIGHSWPTAASNRNGQHAEHIDDGEVFERQVVPEQHGDHAAYSDDEHAEEAFQPDFRNLHRF